MDLHTYGPTHLHTYGPTDLPTYTPTDLQTYRPMNLKTYTPMDLQIYGPIHLQTYLPTHLRTYRPTHLHTYGPTDIHTYWLTDLSTYVFKKFDQKPSTQREQLHMCGPPEDKQKEKKVREIGKEKNQAAGNQGRSSTEWVIIQQYQIINTESNGKSNFKGLSPKIIRNFLRGVENTQRLLSDKFILQDQFPKNIASALLYSASALLCRCKGSKYDLTWIPLGWSNSKNLWKVLSGRCDNDYSTDLFFIYIILLYHKG